MTTTLSGAEFRHATHTLPPSATDDRLLRHGAVLFLLGLLTGFVLPFTANPRMALAAHLEGVMNGMFLVLLGLLWGRLRLSAGARRWLAALALYGTYANWAATLLAACFGTSRSTPIAGAGHGGAAWQEMVVDVGLFSLSFAMVAALVLVLRGLDPQTAAYTPGRDRPCLSRPTARVGERR